MAAGWRLLLYSTRSRVLVSTLILLAATVAAFVLVDRAMLFAHLDERIDADLVHQVEEFERLAKGTDPATGKPFAENVSRIFDVYFEQMVVGNSEFVLGLVGGKAYAHSAKASYPSAELSALADGWGAVVKPKFGSATTANGYLRWLAVPVAAADGSIAGTIIFGRLPASERAAVDEAVRAATVAGFAVLLAASVLAWFIIGQVLSPLHELAAAATAVRGDDLNVRIPATGTGELADLSSTFNSMLERVEDAFTTQRTFLDDASHELRTPLTVMRGHLELAPTGEPLPAATRHVVFDELDRMGRIVEDLLVLAKATQVNFIVTAPTDVADLTVEIVDKARTLGDRDWVVQPDAVVVALLDRQRIIQAWMNLVRNAVQHTTDGDRITVFSKALGGCVELGVADTGDGVAPAERETIFARFGRGQSVRRSRTDGAGLGLAITAAIAQGHGGEVALYDTPGGGATFVVRLPLEDQPSMSDTEEHPWPAS